MKFTAYFTTITHSVKQRGLINTIQFLWYEILFDLKYGVDTIGRESLDSFITKGDNQSHGKDYQGYSYYYFRKFLSKLPVDFHDSTFIDFGSGKGKTLIMAAEYRFKKIIGIEFAVELFTCCLKNLEKANLRNQNIEVICEDAANYTIPDDANVMCFYNPFDELVMEKVLDNIGKSLGRSARNIFIIYFTPLFENCFIKRGYSTFFELKNKNKVEGLIYKK